MHVNLTRTLDEDVLTKVKSGRYNNASEVIREALRYMQEREAHAGLNFRLLHEVANLPESNDPKSRGQANGSET